MLPSLCVPSERLRKRFRMHPITKFSQPRSLFGKLIRRSSGGSDTSNSYQAGAAALIVSLTTWTGDVKCTIETREEMGDLKALLRNESDRQNHTISVRNTRVRYDAIAGMYTTFCTSCLAFSSQF